MKHAWRGFSSFSHGRVAAVCVVSVSFQNQKLTAPTLTLCCLAVSFLTSCFCLCGWLPPEIKRYSLQHVNNHQPMKQTLPESWLQSCGVSRVRFRGSERLRFMRQTSRHRKELWTRWDTDGKKQGKWRKQMLKCLRIVWESEAGVWFGGTCSSSSVMGSQKKQEVEERKALITDYF